MLQLLQTGTQVVPHDPVETSGATLPPEWLADVEPSAVEVLALDGTADGTLGDRAEKVAGKTCAEIQDRRALYSGGIELSFTEAVNYESVVFDGGPRLLRHGGYTAQVSHLRCGIVVRIHQRPLVIDRATVFDFAVVVEDYLDATRTIVSRKPGASASWEPARRAASSEVVVDSSTLIVAARLRAPLPHEEVMRVMSQSSE